MIALEDNAGFVQVRVGQLDVQLDLYEANNTYAALSAEHDEDLVALGAAWSAWLQSRGLPAISHGAAFRIADGVLEQVREFKKKDSFSPTPDSAASTASPSAA